MARAGPQQFKFSEHWGYGVYLGRAAESDEHILGTRVGVIKARTVRRLATEDRHDVQLLLSMRGVPWAARVSTTARREAIGLLPPVATSSGPGGASPAKEQDPTPRPNAGAAGSSAPGDHDAAMGDAGSPAPQAGEGPGAPTAQEAQASTPAGQAVAQDTSVEHGVAILAKRPRGRPVTRVLPHPLSWSFTQGCSACEGSSYRHSTFCRQKHQEGPSAQDLEREEKRMILASMQGQKREGDAEADTEQVQKVARASAGAASSTSAPATTAVSSTSASATTAASSTSASATAAASASATEAAAGASSAVSKVAVCIGMVMEEGESVAIVSNVCYEGRQPLHVPTDPEPKFERAYYDEDDGSKLPHDQVQDGIRRELDFMHSLGVGRRVLRSDVPPGCRIWGGCWCHRRKGEGVRSRYVAQQFRDSAVEDSYAGTPRTEAVRIVMADALHRGVELMCADFSVAFLHTPMDGPEKTYVEMPMELRQEEDEVWELPRALYGLRQAAQRFQTYLTKLIVDLGFEQCGAEAMLFRHVEKGLTTVVHIDDPLTSGPQHEILRFYADLNKHIPVRIGDPLGAKPQVSWELSIKDSKT